MEDIQNLGLILEMPHANPLRMEREQRTIPDKVILISLCVSSLVEDCSIAWPPSLCGEG